MFCSMLLLFVTFAGWCVLKLSLVIIGVAASRHAGRITMQRRVLMLKIVKQW